MSVKILRLKIDGCIKIRTQLFNSILTSPIDKIDIYKQTINVKLWFLNSSKYSQNVHLFFI